MGNKARGLYNKFIVTRVDGTSAAGEKHDGCRYFVLDLNHDKFAAAALGAYAEACKHEYPLLALSLVQLEAECDPTCPIPDCEGGRLGAHGAECPWCRKHPTPEAPSHDH